MTLPALVTSIEFPGVVDVGSVIIGDVPQGA
jgi:hypothetical protein